MCQGSENATIPNMQQLNMVLNILNPFSTNAPLTDKPGSWFSLAKCLKNTCGRVILSKDTSR